MEAEEQNGGRPRTDIRSGRRLLITGRAHHVSHVITRNSRTRLRKSGAAIRLRTAASPNNEAVKDKSRDLNHAKATGNRPATEELAKMLPA